VGIVVLGAADSITITVVVDQISPATIAMFCSSEWNIDNGKPFGHLPQIKGIILMD
jgi:hypothetical protein